MRKLPDMTGSRFGRLLVLERSGTIGHNVLYSCLCDCGNVKDVRTGDLRSGRTTSCGCYTKEVTTERNTTHGESKTGLYGLWLQMKNRCYNPRTAAYKHYGGRGISVCDKWLDFECFKEDVGERANGMTLDRIDNDGNYCPENCKWATRREQSRNRRNTTYAVVNGVKGLLMDFAKEAGVSHTTVRSRLSRGLSIEESLRK